MNYTLLKELIDQVAEFESQLAETSYSNDIQGFTTWMQDSKSTDDTQKPEPGWEGKDIGRSPESVISTLLVRMGRYGRSYSRSAIQGSQFSTQDEFVYLILLKAFGPMTKMELIRRNIQDKPTGMQIIQRLLGHGWIAQSESETDKRSKVIRLTVAGEEVLAQQMDKIRQATQIVSGTLSHEEKMELIRLLDKLDKFHHDIYNEHISSDVLLDLVIDRISSN